MSKIQTIIDRPDGSVVGVNLKRIAEMPYFLCTNAPNDAIVVPANQSRAPVVMSMSGEGPGQIIALSAERIAAARVFLQIQDGQKVTGLMNAAVHIDTIFGNHNVQVVPNSRPYPMPEALYIDDNRLVLATLIDISGADNTIRLVGETQRFLSRFLDTSLTRIRARMEKKQYLTMPYWYTFDQGVSVMAGGATNIETITIALDHHFELFQLSAVSTGLFNLQIQNVATGETLIDAPLGQSFPVSSGLIVGSAAFPFRFHEPRFFELGSKLLLTLENRTGVQNTVFLTLGGRALADRMWR